MPGREPTAGPEHGGDARERAVLVGLAHDERLDPQRVLADDQVTDRLQLVGTGQGHRERAVTGVLPGQILLGERLLDQPGDAAFMT